MTARIRICTSAPTFSTFRRTSGSRIGGTAPRFTAPAGHTTYALEFPGINYRAEVWLNGHLVAGNNQIVGMYNAHELDVSPWINRGGPNTLAVKVTPERSLQDVNGVELADSWYDWINWNKLGYQGPEERSGNPSPAAAIPLSRTATQAYGSRSISGFPVR